ncbi:MAG: hypothetical protein HUK07_00150 [Bacteroidaceae bacterium]|nr:hypothetical protein [Bacteroidaceae bacterium]
MGAKAAKYLLVYRDERFSPGAVERDKAMLDAVGQMLSEGGKHSLFYIHEHELQTVNAADYADCTIVHMTRSAEALTKIAQMQSLGARVLNEPQAILHCQRAYIEEVMVANGLSTPTTLVEKCPELSGKGWWIKSNETTDSTPSHIQFCETLSTDFSESDAAKSGKLLVQPHIEGQNIKFYGVRNTDFFHVRESISTAVLQQLCTAADTLAAALSLDIYGGDAILTAANHLTIIDFNDFPSFSSCRKEAAEAIFCAVRQIKNH